MVELILILVISAVIAGLAYAKAHRLHLRIEALHPGFNALMRHFRR